MFQRFGSSERREEGGGRGLRPGARPNIHGDIRQDCRQRGGGLHQHRQGDIRQDPGGSVRYQQRGEWYQDRASAQHRGRGLRGRGAGRSRGRRRLLLEARLLTCSTRPRGLININTLCLHSLRNVSTKNIKYQLQRQVI